MNSNSRRGSISHLQREQSAKRPLVLAWKHIEPDRSTMTIDEFDDDDIAINTPHSVREAAHLSKVDIFLSRNNTTLFGKRRQEDHVPQTHQNGDSDSIHSTSRVHEDANRIQNDDTLLHFDGSSRRKRVLSSPPQKLINDENAFTPGSPENALSPPRRLRVASMGIPSQMEDPRNDAHMAFDLSDRDLPEKRPAQTLPLKRRTLISDSPVSSGKAPSESSNKHAYVPPSISASVPFPGGTTPKRSENGPPNIDRTPKRMSPLRHEILPSSSIRSSATDLIEEIRRSGALEPRSEAEIHDRINASLMELEKASRNLEPGSEDEGTESSLEVSDSDSDSEDEKGLLDGLQKYVPADTDGFSGAQNEAPPELAAPADNAEEVQNGVPYDAPSPPVTNRSQTRKASDVNGSPIASSLQPVTPAHGATNGTPKLRKNRAIPTGKLSGKYARKTIKDRRTRAQPKTYADWLQEQWDKLQLLVDLDVANNVIINSPLVHKALRCTDKQELSYRVQFLLQMKQR